MSGDHPTGILAHAHAGNRLAGAYAAAMLASPLVILALAERLHFVTLFGPGTLRLAVIAWLGCIVGGFAFPRLPVCVVRVIEILG